MRRLLASLLLALAAATSAGAQQPAPASARAGRENLNVFLDCRTWGCDRNFFIQELPYVLWTQNQFDADVQAVVTALETGAGGREFTILLLGRGRFEGRADTLVATVPPNSTDDMERRELARVLKIGLAPYALRTGAGPRLSIAYAAPPADSSSAARAQAADPWNFWVYRLASSGNIGAESQAQNYRLESSFNASRVTETWKIGYSGEFEYNGLVFDPDSGETQTILNRSAELEGYFVRSLSDHWSVAVASSFEMSEFRNLDFGARVETGVEWNYFPWREATSRQLVAIAAVGLRHFDYRDTTIYFRTEETRPVAIAKIASEVRQPWGELFAGIEHVRYLHDASVYSLNAYGYMSVRVSRALRVNIGSSASKVNDQLYLPAGGLDPSLILTRQRALRTAYRVDLSVGVSYTFGSIFNTIVNPRFENY